MLAPAGADAKSTSALSRDHAVVEGPEGMVTIQIGNNAWAGGTNNSGVGISTFLSTATVTEDGKVIIENGKLKK